MKTPFVLSLLLALSPIGARAELALYNLTARQTVAGLGVETTLVHSGVLLWDIDTGRAWQLNAFRTAAGKQFTVRDQSDALLYHAQGRLHTFTAVLSITNAPDRQAITFAFGRDATFALRPGRTVTLPRTARFNGYAFIRFPAGDVFGPITGAYSFSPSRTRLSHTAGHTLEQALAWWRAYYTTKGYTEAQP